MNLIKKLSLSGLIFLFFMTACMAEKEPAQAWWLDFSVKPESTQLDGIDISSFRKNWTHAVYLDNSLIKNKVSFKNYTEFKDSNFKLSIIKDFNNNNIDEVIKVGVFQTKKRKGIFLAIFESSKLIKVFTDSSNKGFSALLSNNNLHWYKCMNCGEYESISWNGKTFVLE